MSPGTFRQEDQPGELICSDSQITVSHLCTFPPRPLSLLLLSEKTNQMLLTVFNLREEKSQICFFEWVINAVFLNKDID